jgi:hypothetical protein
MSAVIEIVVGEVSPNFKEFVRVHPDSGIDRQLKRLVGMDYDYDP